MTGFVAPTACACVNRDRRDDGDEDAIADTRIMDGLAGVDRRHP